MRKSYTDTEAETKRFKGELENLLRQHQVASKSFQKVK